LQAEIEGSVMLIQIWRLVIAREKPEAISK